MSDLRELLQEARDYIAESEDCEVEAAYGDLFQRIDAALAESEQEPVALARAVLDYDEAIKSCADDPKKMASFCTAQGDTLDMLYMDMLRLAAAPPPASPADARDAARYRWLMKQEDDSLLVRNVTDEAIDAAIEREGAIPSKHRRAKGPECGSTEIHQED